MGQNSTCLVLTLRATPSNSSDAEPVAGAGAGMAGELVADGQRAVGVGRQRRGDAVEGGPRRRVAADHKLMMHGLWRGGAVCMRWCSVHCSGAPLEVEVWRIHGCSEHTAWIHQEPRGCSACLAEATLPLWDKGVAASHRCMPGRV